MKPTSPRLQPIAAFLHLECTIYILFLALDLLGRFELSLWPKYSGILLCVVFSLTSRDRIVCTALVLSAVADWFLLVRNDHWLLGVLLFLCVQFLYLLRLHRAGCLPVFRLHISLAVTLESILVLLDMATPLNLLSIFYFSLLVSNAILAWSMPSMRLFAWGLVLSVCCDFCVGLFHVALLPPSLCAAVRIGMWLFYLPSQVFIVLSTCSQKEVSP